MTKHSHTDAGTMSFFKHKRDTRNRRTYFGGHSRKKYCQSLGQWVGRQSVIGIVTRYRLDGSWI